MFVLIRSMRGYAGNAFAGWRFSESTYPTLIVDMLFVRNSVDAAGIEWGGAK
jgi:hypothetical protein